MSQAGWRKWHRWIGLASSPLLLFAAVTGIIAGIAEMFDADEEAREKARERVSEVRLPATPATASDPISKALADAGERAPGAPVDKVLIDFKTEPPTVAVYLGNASGGEDRRLLYDARTGQLLREEPYIDKPFLVRLHSGEAFGDWGLAVGTGWGAALVALLVTGTVIYVAMWRPGRKGLGRVFW